MKSSINLASSPFIPYRRFMVTGGLVAAAVLILTVFVGIKAVYAWQERTSTRAQLHALEAERARLVAQRAELEEELRAPATQAVLQQVGSLNDLIRQKNLSWTQLFFDLAERLPEPVRVYSLAPSLREDGRVEVEMRVSGKSAVAIIDFLRALEGSPKFHGITLHSQSHSTEREEVTAEVSVLYAQGRS